ncbi:protein ORF91 [Cyprinid herpesvirus 1]|uniref:Protein ORF91 n=1 Tax=Cyprinid herpesvirus 1 TaxID=317858 RepID=K7PBX5_9VIRU|nr:protein ORF91 [Cyprinid herpesvirus 1]AFJ20388.1 protein ORF91 [Cyprinid herpesvirus 1]
MSCAIDACNTVTSLLTTLSGRFLHWLDYAVSKDIREFEEEREYRLDLDADERLVLLESEARTCADAIVKVTKKPYLTSVDRINLKAAKIQLRNKHQAYGAELMAQVSLERTKDVLVDQALTEKRFYVQSSLRKSMKPQVAFANMSHMRQEDAFGRHLEDLLRETQQDHYSELKEEFSDLAETNEDDSEDEGEDIATKGIEERSRSLGIGIIPSELIGGNEILSL